MTYIKIVTLILGLIAILVLPLRVLLLIAVILAPVSLKISRKRLIHVLPFWLILSLPVAFGNPEGSLLLALRSLDSLIWISLLFWIWNQEDSRKLLLSLPTTLRWVTLLILKHAGTFLYRLKQSTYAMKLRWGSPPVSKYGAVLRGFIYLSEKRARNITYAMKLREPE